MRKLVLLSFVIVASLQFCGAQSLDKMQWFNEPEQWEIKDKSLSMQVTPQSDYWRISHYGFTVDDAPFYYATYGGEFEVKVKITGDYKQRFDQAGLMLRINHENYIKIAVKINISAAVFYVCIKAKLLLQRHFLNSRCSLYTCLVEHNTQYPNS